jgi:hypothetical protein
MYDPADLQAKGASLLAWLRSGCKGSGRNRGAPVAQWLVGAQQEPSELFTDSQFIHRDIDREATPLQIVHKEFPVTLPREDDDTLDGGYLLIHLDLDLVCPYA